MYNNAYCYTYRNNPCCDRGNDQTTCGESALEAHQNCKPMRENGVEHEDNNGDGNGNGNGDRGGTGNGNGLGGGNGNGNPNVNTGGTVPVARECTYQDFMKCQPLNFKGTEGVALMKLMTVVYCPMNEIQKIETKFWNLTVRNHDLTANTQRFQELVLLYTKMVPEEEDRVEKFIGGLPNNIQGNVIDAEPVRLQDDVRIANNSMDQKLKGYAARNAENKRRCDNNLRDNRVQQPPFK
ncbi:hypothetical protein Tco_1073045, partial [Tanacetum coccineum]